MTAVMERSDENPEFKKGHWVRVTNEDHEFYNEDFIVIALDASGNKAICESMEMGGWHRLPFSDIRQLSEFQDPKTLRAK